MVSLVPYSDANGLVGSGDGGSTGLSEAQVVNLIEAGYLQEKLISTTDINAGVSAVSLPDLFPDTDKKYRVRLELSSDYAGSAEFYVRAMLDGSQSPLTSSWYCHNYGGYYNTTPFGGYSHSNSHWIVFPNGSTPSYSTWNTDIWFENLGPWKNDGVSNYRHVGHHQTVFTDTNAYSQPKFVRGSIGFTQSVTTGQKITGLYLLPNTSTFGVSYVSDPDFKLQCRVYELIGGTTNLVS